jgi:hypothetical protein
VVAAVPPLLLDQIKGRLGSGTHGGLEKLVDRAALWMYKRKRLCRSWWEREEVMELELRTLGWSRSLVSEAELRQLLAWALRYRILISPNDIHYAPRSTASDSLAHLLILILEE